MGMTRPTVEVARFRESTSHQELLPCPLPLGWHSSCNVVQVVQYICCGIHTYSYSSRVGHCTAHLGLFFVSWDEPESSGSQDPHEYYVGGFVHTYKHTLYRTRIRVGSFYKQWLPQQDLERGCDKQLHGLIITLAVMTWVRFSALSFQKKCTLCAFFAFHRKGESASEQNSTRNQLPYIQWECCRLRVLFFY